MIKSLALASIILLAGISHAFAMVIPHRVMEEAKQLCDTPVPINQFTRMDILNNGHPGVVLIQMCEGSPDTDVIVWDEHFNKLGAGANWLFYHKGPTIAIGKPCGDSLADDPIQFSISGKNVTSCESFDTADAYMKRLGFSD